jgi:acetolactate synthase-1/2/3 large subunit
MTKMNGYQAVVQALLKEKVKYFFGLPGNPRAVYEQLYDAPEIKPILVRHECSGVLMAMAYARVSGETGVCYAPPGPGVANLVPGFLEAYYTCTPLVAPCPYIDLKNDGKAALQECDQIGMFEPVTKWTARVPMPERVPWYMRRAFYLARNGKPGPIFLEIPYNVGFGETEMPEYVSPIHLRMRGDPDQLRAAVDLILRSERPVLIAGGGTVLSGAQRELVNFAELVGIPVMTTPRGRGSINEEHPLAIGQVGIYRTRVGKQIQSECDLLITIGTRNEEIESAAWTHKPNDARFIQIDIDPFEIGRNWIPDTAIVGDAKLVLADLIETMSSKIKKKRLEEMPRIKALMKAKEEYEAEVENECRAYSVPIKTKRIMRELTKIFGNDTILCNENGMQDLWSYYFPYYKVLSGGDAFAPGNQTLMGTGVAGAIGAKLAAPQKKVVCTTGDGAFQMFMKEMPTAVQHNAPVTWVILNNYSLGWPKFYQKVLGEHYIATDFKIQPDFVKVAEASKCFGQHVERPDDVESALRTALKKNNEGVPAVLDFVIDPWDCPEGFKDFFRELRGIDI